MNRILVFTVLLVGLLAVSGLAALPRFDTMRLYSESQFAAAIKPYADAISRNASDAEGHYWLGVAYLHGARIFRLGLASYGADFAAKAAASLERAVQLKAEPAAMLALLDAYGMVGDHKKYNALIARIGDLAKPLPLK